MTANMTTILNYSMALFTIHISSRAFNTMVTTMKMACIIATTSKLNYSMALFTMLISSIAFNTMVTTM